MADATTPASGEQTVVAAVHRHNYEPTTLPTLDTNDFQFKIPNNLRPLIRKKLKRMSFIELEMLIERKLDELDMFKDKKEQLNRQVTESHASIKDLVEKLDNMSKLFTDLKMVHKNLRTDFEKTPRTQRVLPIKITRSVGLQVTPVHQKDRVNADKGVKIGHTIDNVTPASGTDTTAIAVNAILPPEAIKESPPKLVAAETVLPLACARPNDDDDAVVPVDIPAAPGDPVIDLTSGDEMDVGDGGAVCDNEIHHTRDPLHVKFTYPRSNGRTTVNGLAKSVFVTASLDPSSVN